MSGAFFFQILKKMNFFSNPEKIAISLSFALYRIISTMSEEEQTRRQRRPRGPGQPDRPFLQRVRRNPEGPPPTFWELAWRVIKLLQTLMIIWSFFKDYFTK
jgi:hypothetical protein